jgi:hypothetical protein
MKNMFDSAPCAYYLPGPEAACLSKLADILCDPTCSQSRPQDRQNQICPLVEHFVLPSITGPDSAIRFSETKEPR